MSVVQHRSTLTRRRHSAATGTGNQPQEQVSDLIRVAVEPAVWSAHKHGGIRVFRGLMAPGTISLPARTARLTSGSQIGTDRATIGLSSRPIVLRGMGLAYPVPANVPWVVLSDVTWRITASEPIDLRLVHGHELSPGLVSGSIASHRPTRFQGRECEIVRAAVKSATPVWIDDLNQPLHDLAAKPVQGWSLVRSTNGGSAQDHDQLNAFALLMTWAFEQRREETDPRIAAIYRYIRSRLSDPTLNTHTIAAHARVSRRTLQSWFEGEGGVTSYIRRLRLTAALQLITREPDQTPDLHTVAELTGFGSRRTLERAMRQVYDLTPRQARAHILAGNELRGRQALSELAAS